MRKGEIVTKGQRKATTFKWQLKATFDTEARQILQKRSSKMESFLDLVLKDGFSLEPSGRLAGKSEK